MCCFSGLVRYVGQTQIFARMSRPGVQFLAYQMHYQSEKPVAMLLPIPAAQPAADNKVRFVNLRDYSELFRDLEKAFPADGGYGAGGFGGGNGASRQARPVLAAESVGDFVASWVPSVLDFDRLDPRFRLPKQVWDQLPQYRNCGFAVFQLKPGADKQIVHPMALEFPTALQNTLYFPTVHIHDGIVHPSGMFDHTLYVQAAYPSAPQSVLRKSWDNAGRFVNREKAQEIVALDQPLFKMDLAGERPNRDTLVRYK